MWSGYDWTVEGSVEALGGCGTRAREMSANKIRRRKRIREVTAAADREIGAEVTNSARYQGARVAVAFSEPLLDDRGDQYTPTIDDVAADLRRAIAGVKSGNLDELESMLLAQGKALQAMFAHFAVKAAGPWSMNLTPAYAALAFKAQSQARATIIALAELKRPRQANFIGQQNVAVNQQVNNALTATSPLAFPPIELLEAPHGQRMDTRTEGAASGGDPPMEAVGAIIGSAHERGEGNVES
jgi:hypothetical protein